MPFVSIVLACSAAGACATAPEAAVLTPPVGSVSPMATATATASVKDGGPHEPLAHAKALGENDPLEAGLVTFEGMIRLAKGGLDVRGVLLDEGDVKHWLASPVANTETLIGARVRVTASLVEHDDAPSRTPRGEIVQERSGHFFRAKELVAVTVVAEAQVVEGTLGRSKGFFTLEGKLLDHHDLDRALLPKPAASGEHVKVYGQARTVVCDPRAQCLIEGSLPLFDIARAERLP